MGHKNGDYYVSKPVTRCSTQHEFAQAPSTRCVEAEADPSLGTSASLARIVLAAGVSQVRNVFAVCYLSRVVHDDVRCPGHAGIGVRAVRPRARSNVR